MDVEVSTMRHTSLAFDARDPWLSMSTFSSAVHRRIC